jgi:hypothetical protein
MTTTALAMPARRTPVSLLAWITTGVVTTDGLDASSSEPRASTWVVVADCSVC